ncbi:sensor histidine kinase [Thermoflavifilum thermophilum]|uniref:Histidine kinase n=1 Tax=Thermoflavifilum thermophilum TaxID=1393122 RepID=A0A1I7N6F5_9BACT|nr:histidine kinase [Thermoflavifilum thermophilum]SFV30227.1 Histidine kinase [Thermoflavifilum thermophilum]
MFRRVRTYYWWCQIGGWMAFWMFSTLVSYMYGQRITLQSLIDRTVFILAGIGVTHAFRLFILRHQWLQLRLDRLIWRMLMGVLVSSVLITATVDAYKYAFHLMTPQEKSFEFGRFFSIFIIVLIWSLIYILWHYVEKERRYQLDRLRLESLVKELQLKTIKSQLNPHFIFNALNSIRALIEENPERAREAVTELSNILRNSMQAEKVETVSLENEITMVRDYLALEMIRFEERLQVKFNIDPETLPLPVPPLMLQTLVENAVKHGISRAVQGGCVEIMSRIHAGFLEIVVRNTGQLAAAYSVQGFGLQSTRQRLEILYGSRARFQIANVGDHQVEARVQIPLVEEPVFSQADKHLSI